MFRSTFSSPDTLADLSQALVLYLCRLAAGMPHRESKVPKWELGGRIFQMNFNIFFENISDNGT